MLSAEGLQHLCRARSVLLSAGDERVSIRRLARDCGLSPYHFIRRFKAVFGETPHQLQVRFRLERAKEMLLSGGESVTDVSLRLGYSSLGSFSARFAREVGMSPSAFRRTVGQQRPVSCFGLMAGEGS